MLMVVDPDRPPTEPAMSLAWMMMEYNSLVSLSMFTSAVLMMPRKKGNTITNTSLLWKMLFFSLRTFHDCSLCSPLKTTPSLPTLLAFLDEYNCGCKNCRYHAVQQECNASIPSQTGWSLVQGQGTILKVIKAGQTSQSLSLLGLPSGDPLKGGSHYLSTRQRNAQRRTSLSFSNIGNV